MWRTAILVGAGIMSGCAPEAVLKPPQADLIFVVQASDEGRIRSVDTLSSGDGLVLPEVEAGRLILYEIQAEHMRDANGLPVSAEQLDAIVMEPNAQSFEGCSFCLDAPVRPPMRMVPGSSCFIPDWIERTVYSVDGDVVELDAGGRSAALAQIDSELRLRTMGSCPCAPRAIEPDQLRVERRYPVGAGALPLAKTVDPETAAVAVWYTDRVELHAPGGREAFVPLPLEAAEVTARATTAHPCAAGANVCFTAATERSLLRVRWPFSGTPEVRVQALPMSAWPSGRASPAMFLQAAPTLGGVFLRFVARDGPTRSSRPAIALCGDAGCEFANCAAIDAAATKNWPRQLWPSESGGFVTLTHDVQLVTVGTEGGLAMACVPLTDRTLKDSRGEADANIRRVEDLLWSDGRFYGLIQSSDGDEYTFVARGESELESSKRSLGTIEGGPSRLIEHPFDAGEAVLVRENGERVDELDYGGRDPRPSFDSIVRPGFGGWPSGTREAFRTNLGVVADTHHGLEWLPSAGRPERLWGVQGHPELRRPVLTIPGDDLLLVQSSSTGTMEFTTEAGPWTRTDASAGLAAGDHEPGFIRNLGYAEAGVASMDRISTQTGLRVNHELAFGELGLPDHQTAQHVYLGEGVSAIIVAGAGNKELLLWAPDAPLIRVGEFAAGDRFALGASPSGGIAWTFSSDSVGRLRHWRTTDGHIEAEYTRSGRDGFLADLGLEKVAESLRSLTPWCSTKAAGVLNTGGPGQIFFVGGQNDISGERTFLADSKAGFLGLDFVDGGRSPTVYSAGAGPFLFAENRANPAVVLPPGFSFRFRRRDGRLTVWNNRGDVFLEQNCQDRADCRPSTLTQSFDSGQSGVLESSIDGTEGFDALVGDGLRNHIRGFDGDDSVRGSSGSDLVNGNPGRDVLFGNSGNDDVHGGADNDIVFGGADNDNVYGGMGDDELHGDTGDDRLFGGPGNDTYVYERGGGIDIIDDESGDDVISCPQHTDVSVTRVREGDDLLLIMPDGRGMRIVAQFSGREIETISCGL